MMGRRGEAPQGKAALGRRCRGRQAAQPVSMRKAVAEKSRLESPRVGLYAAYEGRGFAAYVTASTETCNMVTKQHDVAFMRCTMTPHR